MTNRNRRPTGWFMRIQTDQAVASGNQFARTLDDGFTGTSGVVRGATVTMIVGQLIVVPDLSDQHTHHSWGIVMLDNEAFVGGSIPDVDIENERVSWMWRDGGDASMTSLFDHSQETTYRFDIRSQRVYADELRRLVFVLDQGSGGGVFVSLRVRTLIKFR